VNKAVAKTLPAKAPEQEHSIPWFWPFAAAIELEEEGTRLFRQNVEFLAEAGELATPAGKTVQKLVPGGHIGLFMGACTLADTWPEIGAWIAAL
jgi:hypothetical protein